MSNPGVVRRRPQLLPNRNNDRNDDEARKLKEERRRLELEQRRLREILRSDRLSGTGQRLRALGVLAAVAGIRLWEHGCLQLGSESRRA